MPENQLVPQENGQLVAPPIDLLGTSDPRYAVWSSLDLKDPKQQDAYLKAMLDADFNADNLGDRIFNLQNLIIHGVQKQDPASGEMLQLYRIVLIDADGTTFECTSSGIRSSLRNIARAKGNPPWNPPIPVKLKKHPASVGKLYLLVPAGMPDAPTNKKK